MALSLNETIKHETAKTRETRPWQFQKGQSGNPEGGRRHTKYASSAFNAQDLARTHTKEGIATLVFYMRQRSNAAIAVRAAEILLNRAWGVPSQDIKLNADLTVSIAAIVHDARQRAINPLEKPLIDSQPIDPSPQDNNQVLAINSVAPNEPTESTPESPEYTPQASPLQPEPDTDPTET